MRFHALCLVRFLTITIPVFWFLYVVHTLFILPVDLSPYAKDLKGFLTTLELKPDWETTVPEVTKTAGSRPQGLMGNKDEILHHDDLTSKKQRIVFKVDKDEKRVGGKRDVVNMALKEEERGQGQTIHLGNVFLWLFNFNSSISWIIYGLLNSQFRSGYRRASCKMRTCCKSENKDQTENVTVQRRRQKEDQKPQGEDLGNEPGAYDADPYADVTYPPYVETLPPGAKGNGPKGLTINKASLTSEQQQDYEDKWNRNQFNQYASDLIPVHRDLPDFRSKECQAKQYPSALPSMSVVIIFHNEAWSVLLRSVHSVLTRTPSHLLQQVILVDDFSSMDHLKDPLDKYFRNYPKVKILRAPKRGGLIKARLQGFEVTTGEVVVFLDSHIECTEGWAEPMLWMISENYRTVPFPLIDMIMASDLGYSSHYYSPIGVFNMNSFTFRWASGLKRPIVPPTEPKPSPTMPGGLFAISRKWFEELGKYDPELDYWGGENLELSFKTWMCGGSVVIAECSHVGHIFRTHNPIKWTGSILGNRNYVRVAMVWLDEFKNHYLERAQYQVGDYGDISDRLAIRERLHCHSFLWYVDNVYPEIMEQIVLNATYAGQILHEQSGLCVDKMDERHNGPSLFSCHHQGGNQFWYFAEDKYLQIENKFVCKEEDQVTLSLCRAENKQQWFYNTDTRQLVHVDTGLCLQKNMDKSSSRQLKLLPCQDGSSFQKWTMELRQKFKYR